VFTALGLVAGLQFVRRWRSNVRRRFAWLPLGAGLALYAMLGAGGRDLGGAPLPIDTWAHFFGLGVGAAVGAAFASTRARTPGRLGQVLLTLGVSAVLVGAWVLAFRASGRAPA
jgi:membrane associated rhomboid family serine protease